MSDVALPHQPTDPQLRDRYRGCLLGGAVGDALGAPVEFMGRDEILRRFGPDGVRDYAAAYGRLGAITDDTQMALFCAEGLLRAHVRCQLRGIGPVFASVTSHAYLRWLFTQGTRNKLLTEPESGWLVRQRDLFSRRAPGNTCLAALRAMRSFGEPARNDSKGCGGVMRVAPVGLLFGRYNDEGEAFDAEVFRTGVEDAALTHGHPSGQLPAGVLALVIARLARGHELPAAVDRARAELQRHDGHRETLAAIDRAVELASARPGDPEALSSLGGGWVAEEALAIGLYCALTARDFESAISLAVNHSGDSDSAGAITGNLLGARWGVQAIPARWLEPLELRPVIEAMAEDLATHPEWELDQYAESPETDFYWDRYPGW